MDGGPLKKLVRWLDKPSVYPVQSRPTRYWSAWPEQGRSNSRLHAGVRGNVRGVWLQRGPIITVFNYTHAKGRRGKSKHIFFTKKNLQWRSFFFLSSSFVKLPRSHKQQLGSQSLSVFLLCCFLSQGKLSHFLPLSQLKEQSVDNIRTNWERFRSEFVKMDVRGCRTEISAIQLPWKISERRNPCGILRLRAHSKF